MRLLGPLDAEQAEALGSDAELGFGHFFVLLGGHLVDRRTRLETARIDEKFSL